MKKISIYPDETALYACGGNAGSLNAAVECWAKTLDRSAGALSDLSRTDWCLLADVLNGTWTLPDWSPAFVAAEVEDSQRLDGTGDKWYGDGKGERGTASLLSKIHPLDWYGGQALLAAVRFFWDHHERINPQKDEWWTIAYRVRFLRKRDERKAAKKKAIK